MDYYPPLSALPQTQPGSGMGMTLWLISMAIFVASSLLGSLNYIVTVINLRTKGMSMFRLPLTIWAFFVTAIIGVISFPVLLSAALLLIMDRSFGTSFFLSDIFVQGEVLHYQGGSPVLFEHLFSIPSKIQQTCYYYKGYKSLRRHSCHKHANISYH